MEEYLTIGQVARKLRISISTLKRWLSDPNLKVEDVRNYNNWRLFSDKDVCELKKYKNSRRKKGKRFNKLSLIPVKVKMVSK